MYAQESCILVLASLLSLLPCFYFPTFIDWRGRFYSKGDLLNYQGHKLGLALLKIKEGKPLGVTGLLNLKQYGASLYGVSGDVEKKLHWVDNNHTKIYELDISFIKKAKNKELFVAFCIEYNQCMKSSDPLTFVSNLPILMDCTCNGLQHLAAMLCDIQTAKYTNLTPDPVKHDMYTLIVNKIQKQLKQCLGEDVEITRKHVKKIVMTIPYNVTPHSAYKYFLQNFKYDASKQAFYMPENPSLYIKHQFIYEASLIIYKEFFKINPKIKELVTYFKNIAMLMSTLNLPIK